MFWDDIKDIKDTLLHLETKREVTRSDFKEVKDGLIDMNRKLDRALREHETTRQIVNECRQEILEKFVGIPKKKVGRPKKSPNP